MVYTNTCVICGKQFQSKYKRTLLCHSPHEKICEVCGKVFFVTSETRNKRFCSLTCSGKYRRESGLGKEIGQKSKETKTQRYGTVNYMGNVRNICPLCGEEYTPNSPHQNTCGKIHIAPCPICGKPSRIYSLKDGPVACSDACRVERSRRSNEKRYGYRNPLSCPEFRAKARKTIKMKYGNEIYQRTEDYKEKSKKTCRERYGTDYPQQNEEVREKTRLTNLRRYGGPSPMSSITTVERIRDNNIEKLGVSHPMKLEKYREKYRSTCMIRYGVDNGFMTDKGIVNNKYIISSNNKKFNNILLDKGIDSVYEFVVGGKRFDIGIPDKNVVVEIDPTYTHNCVSDPHGNPGKLKDYHLERTRLAKEHGYRCIHVWDWDDYEKVAEMFVDKETVYARKCQVWNISQKEANSFLFKYHLQGPCRGQMHCYGLFYNNTLVGVETAGKPRYNRKFEYEIIRLCYRPEYKVLGGSEKMFHRFVSEVYPKSVISYCDKSKFTGDVYKHMGMTVLADNGPSKHWWSYNSEETMNHITDSLLRQRGFDQLFGTHYGKGTDNESLMIQRGYLPVYDCGQISFQWHC